MTPDQIKLNMPVMTPKGKGVVVGWTAPDDMPYLVKLENGGRHNGCAPLLIAGSTEKLNGDGGWFPCEDLTAIEEQMTEQTHYPDWQKLTPLPPEPQPDEKVGAKFVVIDNRSCFEKGEIVELASNYGTSYSCFKSINGNRKIDCYWHRLAPLPQPEEKKVKKITPFPQPAKKLVPFTDEFDWCEEGVLVVVKGYGERYAVRAKGDQVWAVDRGKHLCEVDGVLELSTHNRCICQKVIHEVHRPLTNREFAEFMQDHKGMVKDTSESMIYNNSERYECENENKSVHNDFRFRFRGTEEWHPVTTELYEIARGLNA